MTAKSGLHPAVALYASELLRLASSYGVRLKITEAYRSPSRQARLYAQGRTLPGPIVTNAKPGTSMHEKRLAFDVAVMGPDPYDRNALALAGEIGEALGFRWGGRFSGLSDMPHFEAPL